MGGKQNALIVLIAVLFLGGCAATGIPAQEFAAETIETVQANNTVENDYGMSPMELGALILLAGWAIPSPLEMLGGFSSFILTLFGRK